MAKSVIEKAALDEALDRVGSVVEVQHVEDLDLKRRVLDRFAEIHEETIAEVLRDIRGDLDYLDGLSPGDGE